MNQDSTFTLLLQDLDRLIREGRGREVQRRLGEILERKLERDQRLPLANLARRSGVPMTALKILRPIIRDSREGLNPASADEWAAYGACLVAIGALHEGESIFAKVASETNPEVLLHGAFARFGTWDYQRAIPLLRKYIRSKKISNYQRLVGRVNLCASLVFVRDFKNGDQQIELCLGKAKRQNLKLIQANLLELKAQSLIFRERLHEAEAVLLEAQEILQGTNSIYEVFIEKWRFYIALFSGSSSEESFAKKLDEIKRKASVFKNWETLRELDLYWAVHQNDKELVLRVWRSSNSDAYRQKIKQLWVSRHREWPEDEVSFVARSIDNTIDNAADESLDSGGKPPTQTYLWSKVSTSELKSGSHLHRLLVFLCADTYRPLRLGELFNRLFPGEYFDAVSSPQRIYKLVQRLRRALRESLLDLHVHVQDQEFSVTGDSEVIMAFSRQCVLSVENRRWSELFARFKFQPFMVSEVKVFFSSAHGGMSLSERTVSRLLNIACQAGVIARVGFGRGVRYRFQSQKKWDQEIDPLALNVGKNPLANG